jgi:hypothetical protein
VWGTSGRGDFPLNLLSCAEARVQETSLQQSVGDLLVVGQVLRLAAYGSWPLESQPCQIFENAVCEFFPTASEIDVFDAEDEVASCFDSQLSGVESGAGVSAVQSTGGAGGKSAEGVAVHSGEVQANPGQIPVAAVWQSWRCFARFLRGVVRLTPAIAEKV